VILKGKLAMFSAAIQVGLMQDNTTAVSIVPVHLTGAMERLADG
jgi:hypothetical protein